MDLANLNKDRKNRRKAGPDLSTMMYGKVPPNATDLECAILGAMMLDSSCLAEAMLRLKPEMFYLEANGHVCRALQTMYDRNSKIDVMTVIMELKRLELLDACGGPVYVTKLENAVTSGANIEEHIRIVAEMYLKREAIRISSIAMGDAYEDSSDAFEVVEAASLAMQRATETVISGQSKDITHYGMKVLEQHAAVKQTGVLGVNTHISAIDKSICGLVAPDLIIIAARPGQGKTASALSITYNTSVKSDFKIPCAWFSLEMDGVQLVRRLASIDSGIDHSKIRNGSTDAQEERKLTASINRINKAPIYIDDTPGITWRYVRTKLAILQRKHQIQYAVIDYLQLMSGIGKGGNREQEISEISRELKKTAKLLGIPIIALCQLSRAVESRADKMPQLSDLRESGAIEQDADEVIFLMRPESYQMTEPVTISGQSYQVESLCIASVAKNRHGPAKNLAIKFTAPTMYLSDIEQWTPINFE